MFYNVETRPLQRGAYRLTPTDIQSFVYKGLYAKWTNKGWEYYLNTSTAAHATTEQLIKFYCHSQPQSGDFIVTDASGEAYLCPKDQFSKRYKKVAA